MTILGLITCQVLELEIAHLLAGEPRVSEVKVIETSESRRLAQVLENGGKISPHCIPHLSSFHPVPSSGLTVLVRVLPFGLHRNRQTLQKALRKAAREISRYADGLLLGYGRCGGTLDDPAAMLDLDIPVSFPRDASGPPVDDCVGLLLGSRDVYVAEQRRIPGTFFMTPGWTTHWKSLLAGGAGAPALGRVFAGYERILLVSTPVLSITEMQRRTAPFAELLGLPCDIREGTLAPLQAAWKSALEALPGEMRQPEWN
jgi:hypothetical protein